MSLEEMLISQILISGLEKNKMGKETNELGIGGSVGIETCPEDYDDEEEEVQVQLLKSVDVCDPLE